MADLVPFISFPGIQAIHSCVAHDRHGISPSTIILNILPQRELTTLVGDFRLGTVGGPVRTWKDCLVDATTASVDRNGFITSLILLDRRWKWRYGSIEARYNVRNDRGEIIAEQTDKLLELEEAGQAAPITSTERLPSQLIEILLRKLGEDTPNNPAILDDVPNDLRPEVGWDGGNAALDLQRLCDLLECRIILQPDNRIAIRRLGEGRDIPPGFTIKQTISFDPPNIPDKIRVATAPILYEWDFNLGAVVLDKDEEIKFMKSFDQVTDNALVKILPSAEGLTGWENFDAEQLLGFPEDDRKLALETAYRWYALRFPVFDHPRFSHEQLASYEHISLVERQASDQLTEIRDRAKPPILFGRFFDKDTFENTLDEPPKHLARDTKDKTIWPHGFFIDHKLGLVRLSAPAYRVVEDGANLLYQPAQLKLRISFYLKFAEDRAFRRHILERDTGGRLGTEPLTIVRNDMLAQEWFDFDANGRPVGSPKTNFAKLDQLMEGHITAIQRRFRNRRPETATHIGIVPVTLDGALHSAVYEASQSGIMTTIQRHHDRGSTFANSYDTMRQAETLRSLDSLIDKDRGKNPRRFIEFG